MRSVFTALFLVMLTLVRPAAAQEGVWIQLEAQPSLSEAQARAQFYAGQLENVNGFSLGGNWYGIMIGPFSRADAEQRLRAYRADGRIPFDAFISTGTALGRQFWPVGANATPAATATLQPAAPPEPDETPAEARRSERALTAEERKALQTALQSAGFYKSAIDGAFGRGTRASMSAWQAARGFEPTGILTTAQRKALMDEYNAPLISVGMQRIQDPQAGIEIAMPTSEVRFSRYEPPFAHYSAAGDLGVRLILISQPGDKATLYGLYDILQTLEIVPLEGPRERGKTGFTIEGAGKGIVTHAEASLKDGQVKGFILVWPQGDEDRRTRVLAEMKASFTRTDAVLDPAAGADAEQRIDLVSGLQLRKPRLSRSGFFVDDKGTVVTTAEAVQGCTRITVDHDYVAEVAALDDGLGVALLRPQQELAPMAVAAFRAGTPRLQSDVAVSGYSYEGALGAPSLTFGKLADVSGLNGEMELDRLALAALPGDAGGPVIDAGGNVLGMLLPAAQGARRLPGDVSFSADAQAIGAMMQAAGLAVTESTGGKALSPDALSRAADAMTVLVSCWD